jgi:hypothetical protein
MMILKHGAKPSGFSILLTTCSVMNPKRSPMRFLIRKLCWIQIPHSFHKKSPRHRKAAGTIFKTDANYQLFPDTRMTVKFGDLFSP